MSAELSYREALSKLTARGRFGIKLGTERVAALLEAAGNPERGLRGVLVAGTNGKGSTAAMIASILHSAGHRVGLMPKPHLTSYTERIQVDFQPISETEFARQLNGLEPLLDTTAGPLGPATEFEILTVLALRYLAPRVDLLVCEVGMGGRLDATNVLDLGVAVITNVGLDHQQYLGSTIDAIAGEKAAIIKPGNLAITAATGSALDQVTRRADAAGASVWRLGRELHLSSRTLGWLGSEVSVSGPGFQFRDLRVPLAGEFQAENAALAVAAAYAAARPAPAAFRAGLAETRWPGRLEVVGSSPRVILDGGHNEAGLERVGAELRRLLPGEKLVVVFGAMADKDLPAMLERLRQMRPANVVFTAVPDARAASPEDLRALWQHDNASLEADPSRALEAALRTAGAEGTVLVCGSLYLVGALRPRLVAVTA